jgi:DNA-binding NarL/FixJ family response regulator
MIDETNNTVAVLIVDDSVIFAEGLALLLEHSVPLVESTVIAIDYKSTLSILSSQSIDLIILDVNFDSEDFNGFDIARKVKQLFPEIKIIMLTQRVKIDYYELLIDDIKVDGYLDKRFGIEEILYAITAVVNGEQYIDENIKKMLEIGRWLTVTKREKEVLDLLIEGDTQKEIGVKLFISSRTVESHIKNLCLKMEAKNTAQLIATYTRYLKSNREGLNKK